MHAVLTQGISQTLLDLTVKFNVSRIPSPVNYGEEKYDKIIFSETYIMQTMFFRLWRILF